MTQLFLFPSATQGAIQQPKTIKKVRAFAIYLVDEETEKFNSRVFVAVTYSDGTIEDKDFDESGGDFPDSMTYSQLEYKIQEMGDEYIKWLELPEEKVIWDSISDYSDEFERDEEFPLSF